ncbi:alpha/beta fold hydrolase [Streptomyces sp. NPDC046237]|uniref:alpha/beta hydrolase n=1 Tax=Streptomyces sp. NPDC046237 TaxID=3154914 RepID=UPI0033CD5D73
MPNARPATEVLSVSTSDDSTLSVYRDIPTRPRSNAATIVLVHGASVTADLWRVHTRHLTDLGFRVLRYDQRAHGHTPRGRAPMTIEQLADDLHQILRTLAPTGPLVLAGHSLGALVLQELATGRPQLLSRIQGMLLLSATARGASVLPGRGPSAPLLAAGRSLFALVCAHAPQAVDRVRHLLPDTHRYALTPRASTTPDGPPPCRHGVRHTPTADFTALWVALRGYRADHLSVLEQLGERLLLMAGADDRHIPAAHRGDGRLPDRRPPGDPPPHRARPAHPSSRTHQRPHRLPRPGPRAPITSSRTCHFRTRFPSNFARRRHSVQHHARPVSRGRSTEGRLRCFRRYRMGAKIRLQPSRPHRA